jgi:hypothetical protein
MVKKIELISVVYNLYVDNKSYQNEKISFWEKRKESWKYKPILSQSQSCLCMSVSVYVCV